VSVKSNVPMMPLVLVLGTVAGMRSGPTCTTEGPVEYLGNDVAPPTETQSLSECCEVCTNQLGCSFFTFINGTPGLCLLKNENAPDYSRQNATCISGYTDGDPPAPAPAQSNYAVRVGGWRSQTSDHFVCWTLDASANRGFFWRNYSTASPFGAKLARQASALAVGQRAGRSIMRFGGAGNDYLTYAFGSSRCPPVSEYKRCLNESTWRDVLEFTAMAQARMILGLSMNTGQDETLDEGQRGPFPYPWDSTNAKELLQWTIAKGYDHLLYGLELGNEQNIKYSATQMAHNFATLYNLTLELWPDGRLRPVLFGPDPHGFHRAGGEQLEWMAEWLRHCEALGVPVEGVTHHEYVEVIPTAEGFTAPTRLALSAAIASMVNATVRKVSASVSVWGGEIGPHNGGSPVCNHSSMRWAVFGDSFWYADALASKARHGYSGFCRQDYIGADYGLVDCLTGTPLPDFYTALLWTHTMGPVALEVQLTDPSGALVGDDAVVRAAAHCVASGESTQNADGGVAVLMINLSNRSTVAHFPPALGGVKRAYILEASEDPADSLTEAVGLLGTGIRLNGLLLRTASDGTVPRPKPASVAGGFSVTLPAQSIAFYILPAAQHPAC
jgi:hypothetical protein